MIEFEIKNHTTLPDWYKNYILARDDLESMNDRPFEFVYNSIKLRP